MIKIDSMWLRAAIELSKQCGPSSHAFSVGAILVGADGKEIARGYSRETAANMHAEETALLKATQSGYLTHGATMYTSMEPCSVRLSGRTPCTRHLIDAGVARVVYALAEPNTFVVCQGDRQLATAGISVQHLAELGPLVERINQHLLKDPH
ncbi:dCMP deaminase [Patescibacteria group bacterium]|nr:dCMP deaminase [Patescibacteria group bacterium]